MKIRQSVIRSWLKALVWGLVIIFCTGCTPSALPTPTPPPVPATSTPITANPDKRALWVWDVELVTNDDAKAQFFNFIQSKHISAIYIYATDLLSVKPTALEEFMAESGGVEVELLAGDPSWALDSKHAEVFDFTQNAITFTQDINNAGQPVGLHLDIEPYLLDEWNNDQAGTITQYLNLLLAVREKLTATNSPLQLNVDIPFWYDTIEATYNGQTKPLNQHVQDIVDQVVIMDYRDTAGGGDGIIVHAQNELIYGNQINKLVTVGVETNCIEPAKITFCEQGEAVMEQELSEAKLILQANPAFHGFAIHDYAGYVRLSQSTPTPGATSRPTPSPMSLDTSACPPANAEGTVSPAVAIYSITFLVNGVEQVVRDSNALQALPGDQLLVKEVTICSGEPFEGNGGSVYVEFDPVDQNGQVIAPEVKGTQAVRVSSGFTTIPGPDSWTIDNWRHLSVNSVHYPPGGGTQNPNCEGGICEVDDRVIVGLN